jgi:hypothetical protein
MYDATSLKRYLESAGISDVAEKEFLDSAIPGIEEVEDPERVLNGVGVCVALRKA